MRPSHLCLHVVDVWREAEDDFGVVGVVFAVPDGDVHFDFVITRLNLHSGGGKKNKQHMMKLMKSAAAMHSSAHKGAVTHRE